MSKHWLWFSHSGNICRAFACPCFLSVQHITHKDVGYYNQHCWKWSDTWNKESCPLFDIFFSLGPNKTSPEKWDVLYVLSLTARQMITLHCR